jgi:hypothetical protein
MGHTTPLKGGRDLHAPLIFPHNITTTNSQLGCALPESVSQIDADIRGRDLHHAKCFDNGLHSSIFETTVSINFALVSKYQLDVDTLSDDTNAIQFCANFSIGFELSGDCSP